MSEVNEMSRVVDRVTEQAESFFRLPETSDLPPERLAAVRAEIARRGSYSHTEQELAIGSKLAWRNHARCTGRFNWRSLTVLDFRDLRTAPDIAEACWEHLRVSTNGGALRAVISVFRPALPDGRRIRIWNPQLVRYAGYRRPDGSILGDPLHVPLTEVAMHRGWRGAGTAFDVLPVIIQVDGAEPQLFTPPDDAVLEVPISHPDLPWFADLGLRWHANPAISCLAMEIGGLTYTAAPFSGWYVSSEIGARNLSDHNRYDMLPAIAERMGLDTSTSRSLWRDRALVELNQAVLHSYREAGVHIIDHHVNSAQFITHVERERAQGRACPAEWAWVNPPLSASTTATFHRTYDAPSFDLRPNFVQQSGIEELVRLYDSRPWHRGREESVSCG